MTRRHYDWPALIEQAQGYNGEWRMRWPDESVRLAKRIRLRQHPDLRREDGRLEAMVLHEYGPADARRGDIWVRWVPVHTTVTEEET
jgi:hypothetical protein